MRMTMLVATHEMDFARDVADRVVFMDQGRIVEEGAPTQVLERPREPRTQRFLRRLLLHEADLAEPEPGTETTVIVDRLNLRAAPGIESQLLGALPAGASVRVTGLSETAGAYRFWPVETELDGIEAQGWVWEDGLRANAWTGRLGWMQDIVENVQDARDTVASGWDRATGWIPGLVAPLP